MKKILLNSLLTIAVFSPLTATYASPEIHQAKKIQLDNYAAKTLERFPTAESTLPNDPSLAIALLNPNIRSGWKIAANPSLGTLTYTSIDKSACNGNCTWFLAGGNAEIGYQFHSLGFSLLGGYYQTANQANAPISEQYDRYSLLGAKFSYQYQIPKSNWVLSSSAFGGYANRSSDMKGQLGDTENPLDGQVNVVKNGGFVGGGLAVGYNVTSNFYLGLDNQFTGVLLSQNYNSRVISKDPSKPLDVKSTGKGISQNMFIYQAALNASYKF